MLLLGLCVVNKRFISSDRVLQSWVMMDTSCSSVTVSVISRCSNDLTIGWQNLNPLSYPNATLAPQARPSGENLNYLLSHYSDILARSLSEAHFMSNNLTMQFTHKISILFCKIKNRSGSCQ